MSPNLLFLNYAQNNSADQTLCSAEVVLNVVGGKYFEKLSGLKFLLEVTVAANSVVFHHNVGHLGRASSFHDVLVHERTNDIVPGLFLHPVRVQINSLKSDTIVCQRPLRVSGKWAGRRREYHHVVLRQQFFEVGFESILVILGQSWSRALLGLFFREDPIKQTEEVLAL